MTIEINHITKSFDDFKVLDDINLKVKDGELIALLGPSGSGKTTLLRIIAGLESPDNGTIYLHGEEASDQKIQNRQVGFVFQHYALFRHMNVFDNVAFGLNVKPKNERLSRNTISKRVNELLKLVQLERFSKFYPAQLSGGQRQRVALARALAIEPKTLLLDEPFGSLDAKVRKELRQWLRQLHDRLKMTTIFVTHDQEEALELADRIVVLDEGCCQQVGTPEEVYHCPANPFVFNFLGNVNLFHCRLENGKAYLGNIPIKEGIVSQAETAKVYIRPHSLEIKRESDELSLKGTVKFVNPVGPLVKVEVETDSGESIQIELTQERYRMLRLKRDEHVFIVPKEVNVFVGD